MVRVSSYESTGTFIRRSSSLEVLELLSTLGAEKLRGREKREKEGKGRRKRERERGGRDERRKKKRRKEGRKTEEGRERKREEEVRGAVRHECTCHDS